MNQLVTNSDTLLRPDVGLVLPTLGVHLHSWPIVVLSTIIQPLKWESGCGCIVDLCQRKRLSTRISLALILAALLHHLGLGAGALDQHGVAISAIAAVLLSRESADTKLLKAAFMLLAGLLPTVWTVVACAAVCGVYAQVMGWRVRGAGSKDVAAGNAQWLITWGGRLAKRVNNGGEFHLEYETEGGVVLVGNGRLVGAAGEGLKAGLELRRFIAEDGNLQALQRCVDRGAVVVKGDSVGLQA